MLGSEVKSLRQHKVSMGDAYVLESGMELWVHNLHISEYNRSSYKNHSPLRVRKLLLRRREINKIAGSVKASGITVVPRLVYFNERGLAKVRIALVKARSYMTSERLLKLGSGSGRKAVL
ncbi:smpB family protein [Anaplasma phagocytophilum str. CRT53-1]|uniref:SsrA-binding protein n=1 Tax=Anaplasma phagocytophilum str. CRT53-1 TaxID=1359157 RepID=A0A0F3PK35_ANAPH|nr:smpB family protein [Anaplasma phagocytophilum str. CRT53-1]